MKNNFTGSKGTIAYWQEQKETAKHILFIHGFMEDHQVWNHVVKGLEANKLMVDLLGFGESIPSPDFQFTMEEHAQAIHELLQFLQMDELYVMGHSMGGYITLELSKLNPNIHIGLLHSTCVADSDERKLNRNKTIQVLERDPELFIREFYWNLFAEHRKNEFSDRIELMKQKASKIPVEYIIETVKGLRDRNDNTQIWKLAGGKNILIGGTYDKLINVHELEDLALLAGAEWVEMTQSGHMGFYEEPENLEVIIRNWLDEA